MLTHARAALGTRVALLLILLLGMPGLEPAKALYPGLFYVTNTNDSGAGSLRQAIADALPGDQIYFHSSLKGQTITLASTLNIDKALGIHGPTERVRLSGDQTFTIVRVGPSSGEVTLSLLVIENGMGIEGGGIKNDGVLNLQHSIVTHNSAVYGGGIYSRTATLRMLNTQVLENTASGRGGGVYVEDYQTIISHSIIADNQAGRGGGLFVYEGNVSLMDVRLNRNSASTGGGIENGFSARLALTDVTFSENMADSGGGLYHNTHAGELMVLRSSFDHNQATTGAGIYTGWDLYLENSTFYANLAADYGGGIFNTGTLAVINSTFSENSAHFQGGAIYNQGVLSYANTILANTIDGGDCYQSNVPGSKTFYNVQNLVEDPYSGTYGCGTPALKADPRLGTFDYQGGQVKGFKLLMDSPAIDAGSDADCPTTDQRGMARPQRSHCDIGAYEAENPIHIQVGGMEQGSYLLAHGESQRVSYAGLNTGPVWIQAWDSPPLIASQRVIYKVNGAGTSYSEMLATRYLQLDEVYWLPFYNSMDLDTQLRITRLGSYPASVSVRIDGSTLPGGTFTLDSGETIRKSFPGVKDGPVKIESQQPLMVSQRVIYRVNGIPVSFSEMMGLQEQYLDDTYWLPWHNSVDLDSQLRISNTTGTETAVHVYIGGTEVPESPFLLPGHGTLLKSLPGVNDGPVQVVSEFETPIVVSQRVIYKVNGTNTSFSEMMAQPSTLLSGTYYLPWYNNKDLDTQLRIANLGSGSTTVRVSIGGAEMEGSPFTLAAGESLRKSFAGVNDGPVKIEGDFPILVSQRVIYKVNGVNTSFSEMMALPASQVHSSYLLPWYNSVDLDTQLRFGVP